MTIPLHALPRVSSADVYTKGHLAARLSRTADGGIAFAYQSSYLALGSAAKPLASTLPLTPSPLITPSGSLPAFFAGLLPEGRRISMLARALKTSLDDELTLLLAVGADTPGNVIVVPEGEVPATPRPLVTGSIEKADFRNLMSRVDRISLPGAQAKASASMITFPVNAPGARWILKLDPEDYPHLTTNEHAHLVAARQLGINVADARPVKDRHGSPGLLVTRFDSSPDGSRLAFEDGAQVLGLAPAAKYHPSTEEVISALAGLTRAPRIAARNFYLQALFAWLTGNGDLHAKNLGVLEGPGGFEPAPVYDVPCTLLYGDTTTALSVAGRTRGLRRRHWDELAETVGLPLAAARTAQARALEAAYRLDLTRLPFTGSPLTRSVRELRLRRMELDPGSD